MLDRRELSRKGQIFYIGIEIQFTWANLFFDVTQLSLLHVCVCKFHPGKELYKVTKWEGLEVKMKKETEQLMTD